MRNGTTIMKSVGVCILCIAGLVGGQTVTDIDGNQYPVVKIGAQLWLKKNLAVTRNPAGQSITSYCYNNDPAPCAQYGRLYSWDAAMNGSRQESAQGICPDSWHVPSDEEWKTLEMALGMSRAAVDSANVWRGVDQGTKLAVGGSSGFDVLLAGRRDSDATFNYLGGTAYFWTSTEEATNQTLAWRRCMSAAPNVGRWNTFSKAYAFSIRCVKPASLGVGELTDSVMARLNKIITYEADAYIVKKNPCNTAINTGTYFYAKPESTHVIIGATKYTTLDLSGCASVLEGFSTLIVPVLSAEPIKRMLTLNPLVTSGDQDTISLSFSTGSANFTYLIERNTWLIVAINCTGQCSGTLPFSAVYRWQMAGEYPALRLIALNGDTSLNQGGFRFSRIRINGDVSARNRPAPDAPSSAFLRITRNRVTLCGDLPDKAIREMSIVDMRGVRIYGVTAPRGAAALSWDGMASAGARAPHGAYILRVRTEARTYSFPFVWM